MGSQNSKNGRVIPVINESLGSEAHEQFRYLLGRRFHNVTDIIYDLPNDEIEDVSPIFPTEIKPNNVIFKEGNILNGIPHPDESFDFVHMEVVRVIKIGGWLELCEYELCQNCGPVLENVPIGSWAGKIGEVVNVFSVKVFIYRYLFLYVFDFEKNFQGRDNIITRMVGIKPALSIFMNITSEEYDEMIQKSIEEFN
ncbi:8653_t:CDS:2, partial [Racocetra fulgida]